MKEKFLNRLDIQPLLDSALAYLPNLLAAVLLTIVFWLGIRLATRMLRLSLGKSDLPLEMQGLLVRVTRYSLFAIGLITVVDQLGFNITALLAGAGVAGLAISFAAQDTISNLIAGVAIIVDRPFKKGDWILIGDIHALVEDIRLRTTVFKTFDKETLVLPNKMLTQERIINYTLTPNVRARVSVGIAYKEDIEAARQVMLGTLQGDNKILAEPAPVVIVRGLGASSIDLELRFWTTNPLDKFPLTWKYTEECKKALDAAGIEIPFPHLQMFLEKSEGLAELAERGIHENR